MKPENNMPHSGLANSLPITNHTMMEEVYKKFMREENNFLIEILKKHLGRYPTFEDYSRVTKIKIPQLDGGYFLDYNGHRLASVSMVSKFEDGTITVKWVYELL